MKWVFKVYYQLKTGIPKPVRTRLRQRLMHRQRVKYRSIWPIDPATATRKPPSAIWPENKKFALVLTHDIESSLGAGRCTQLMELEQELGFRSSFNFVPELYTTPPELRRQLHDNGFEVGVHGLLHDGKLYASKKIFMQRAVRINRYLAEWGAVGFRSPFMHHNLEWLHELNILYDASTFDTDPFEPDKVPFSTIFPAWIPPATQRPGYIELPYTLPQDSSLFLYLGENDIRIWKQKLDWLVEQGGMVLLNTHPDYMHFPSNKPSACEYPVEFYRQLLDYITARYGGTYWHVLPREMAAFALKNKDQIPFCFSPRDGGRKGRTPLEKSSYEA